MADKKEKDSRQTVEVEKDYEWKKKKEAEFWGTMARLRWRGGIPMTMDYTRATRYRVKRSELGWGDYFQDPTLEVLLPLGRARAKFVKAAKESLGNRVLDLCCGAGWLSLEQARAGKNVDAVDLSDEEISIAKEYQATLEEKIPGSINWIVADLNTFTCEKNTYDQITAWDGLHHIQEIDRLCSELNRGLKPGGKFMMSERVWGGDERSIRDKIGWYLEQHLWTILPTPKPYTYYRKFKELFKTYKAVIDSKVLRKPNDPKRWEQEGDFVSPFEDISGREMLDAIKKNFEVDLIENYGGFTEEIQRSLDLPRFLRVPVLMFLAWIDQAVVQLGLLDGKIIVLYAHKKEDSE